MLTLDTYITLITTMKFIPYTNIVTFLHMLSAFEILLKRVRWLRCVHQNVMLRMYFFEKSCSNTWSRAAISKWQEHTMWNRQHWQVLVSWYRSVILKSVDMFR